MVDRWAHSQFRDEARREGGEALQIGLAAVSAQGGEELELKRAERVH